MKRMVLSAVAFQASEAAAEYGEITADEAYGMLLSGDYLFIDVRQPFEYGPVLSTFP